MIFEHLMHNLLSTYNICSSINKSYISNTKPFAPKFRMQQLHDDMAMKIGVTWGNTYGK